MNTPGIQSDSTPEQREYAFEEGLEEVIRRMDKILETQEGAVIAVTGSSSNVGKTFLSTELGKRLISKGYAVSWNSDLRAMVTEPYFVGKLEPKRSKRILLFHCEYMPHGFTKREDMHGATVETHKRAHDEALRKKAEEFGLPFTKVDLRVFIYSPNQPFSQREAKFGDILIRNEQAVVKR